MTQDYLIKKTILVSGVLTVMIATLAAVDSLLFSDTFAFSSWGGQQTMAFPTSVCFILLGSAFILRGILIKNLDDKIDRKKNDQ